MSAKTNLICTVTQQKLIHIKIKTAIWPTSEARYIFFYKTPMF